MTRFVHWSELLRVRVRVLQAIKAIGSWAMADAPFPPDVPGAIPPPPPVSASGTSWAAPTWAPPGAPPPQTTTKPSSAAPFIALAVVLGLLVLAGVLVARGSGSKWAKSWDPRVVDLVKFVEQDRELTFKHPIKVEFLTDAQFDAFLNQGGPSDDAADKNAYIVQQALGLVAADYDPAKGKAGEDASTVGVYTPNDKRIRVRGSELTVDVRITLVHELTHALQDQAFNLGKVDRLANTDEEARGIGAIIEGDATLVEQNYISSLGDDDRTDLESVSAPSGSGGLPPAIIATFGLPYLVGDEFVYLIAADGVEARDGLFTDPPTSQLPLIDPLAYADPGDKPSIKAPTVPDPVKNVTDELGPAQWFYALTTMLSPADARSAMTAFGTDRAAFTRTSGTLCVTDNIAPRSSSTRAALRTALESWAAADASNRSLTDADNLIVAKSCATTTPKGDTKIRDALFDLEARNNVMASLRARNITTSNKAAVCVAEDALDTIGAEEAQAATADEAALEQLATDAKSCRV
jgi:hypothetical protein